MAWLTPDVMLATCTTACTHLEVEANFQLIATLVLQQRRNEPSIKSGKLLCKRRCLGLGA